MQSHNLEKMQSLLKDFYNLTQMKICIYDSEENELCFYPEKFSPFCSLLREDENMNLKCKACDKNAFSICKKTRKQYFYTCHAGLLECISPILYEEKIIGYIAIGQIKTNKDQIFESLASLSKDQLQLLEKEFDRLPTFDMQKINSALRILDACTGYEYLKSLIKKEENRIDVLLDNYVSANIENDLSVQRLCSVFHLSHSEIYSVFKEYFNSTPAEFVKIRRLKKACNLLLETSLPINKIAKKCGIPDYNYFSKVFKHSLGISPKQFKKLNLTK